MYSSSSIHHPHDALKSSVPAIPPSSHQQSRQERSRKTSKHELISSPVHELEDRPSSSSASRSKRRKGSYFIFTGQNVQGLKRSEKIDYIIHTMKKRHIDVYLVQETWFEGPTEVYRQIEYDGITAFFHGTSSITCSRGRGGVGIFLSPRAKHAWIQAGAHKPILSGDVIGCARWMCISLRLPNQSSDTLIISAYHPCNSHSTDDVQTYFDHYDQFLQDHTTKKSQQIISCDAQTSLSNSTLFPIDSRILGPFSDSHRHEDSSNPLLRELLHHHHLRAITTDFHTNRSYHTWISDGLQCSAQIDYFFTSRSCRRKIHNCRRVSFGAESDHSAISLKYYIGSQTHNSTKHRNPPSPRPNWIQLVTNPNVREAYQHQVSNNITITLQNVDSPSHHNVDTTPHLSISTLN